MLPKIQHGLLVCLTILLTISTIKTEDVNVTLSLNKTLSVNNKELYGNFTVLKSNSTLGVSLVNIPKGVSFIIFQVHTHRHNVTLYNNTKVYIPRSFVTGTNIGLYGTTNPPDIYFVQNENNLDVKLYITVHGYTNADPIAGGCNMESPIAISPYMHIKYTKDIIAVDAPAAKGTLVNEKCLNSDTNSEVIFYRMYMNEQDFDEDSYFKELRSMLTMDKIKENGIEVPYTTIYQVQRRFLTAYPGTGSVFVAVAYNKNNHSYYSVYVPSYTYACTPEDGCVILDDFFSQFMCASLIFIGLFVCYFGHRYFKIEMFLVGMFAGIIVTYIALAVQTDLERPELLGASVLSGTFFGAIWILLWWFYGIPILSVALSTMHFGFILSAIFYHCAPSGNSVFSSDGSFWTFFIIIMICTSFSLSTITFLSNIMCCAILGAYAVVFAIDYYVGSSLKYFIVNTIRRASVKNFNRAILALPYQWPDAVLTLLWLGLAVSGFLFQHYHNRSRPPFPPPPRSMNQVPQSMVYGAVENGTVRRRLFGLPTGVDRSTAVDERTPLLQEE